MMLEVLLFSSLTLLAAATRYAVTELGYTRRTRVALTLWERTRGPDSDAAADISRILRSCRDPDQPAHG